MSSYVLGCPLHNRVSHCVISCPDAQPQINDNWLHNGAVPLRNQVSLRLSCQPRKTKAVSLPNRTI